MGRTTIIILLVLLVATNLVWLVATVVPTEERIPPSNEMSGEVARLREKVRELGADLEKSRSAPSLTGKAAPEPAVGGPSAPPAKTPARRPPPPTATPEAQRTAAMQVEQWKADVLQIEDPGRRETALRAFEDGIRSEDPALAAACLRTLYELRDSAYDKSRFRDAVRLRLEDEDPAVCRAAAFALLQVEPEPADAEALVRAAAAHPEETRMLMVGAMLAKNRVEGPLADLYVKALRGEDPREVKDVANQLRGKWVAAEVEQAAVDAYRRNHEASPGLWFHILGQFRPTREPRVRLLFEILETAGNDAPQLLDRALQESNLDPAAKALAADLALETLPKAPNVLTRRLCLEVLARVGTAAQAGRLRAYAENPMVDEKLREEAAKVVADLERR